MFDDLVVRIDALAKELRAGGYEDQHDAVREVIDDTQATLTRVNAELHAWETDELAYAVRAADSGFLTLALVCTEKAIEVSQLPEEDYEIGYNYARKKKREDS